MKKCTKCKEIKELTEFHKNSHNKDGLQYTCKACVKVYKEANKEDIAQNRKAHYEANKDKYSAYDAKYREAHKEEIAQGKKAWQEANKEKIAQGKKAYKEANKDDIAQTQKAYREAHKEETAQTQKAYREAHKDKFNAYSAKRRAGKLQATPHWLTEYQHKQIELKYWISNFLTEYTGVQHHVDHIHPLQGETICGLHVPDNLQILTAEENLSKSNKF